MSPFGSFLSNLKNYQVMFGVIIAKFKCLWKDGRCTVYAKSYAIGRKAFLFHTSTAGAEASAVMYSIVETAKANNLNVFQYLYTVLLYMPDYKNEHIGCLRTGDH